jgi:hypothetical protein
MSLRALNRLAWRERGKNRNAEIDADSLLRLVYRLHVGPFDQDGSKPPVPLAAHRHPLEKAGKPHRLPPSDPPPPVAAKGACFMGRAETVRDAPFLEPGISSTLLEEGPECRAKVDNRFLYGAFGDLEHPRVWLPLEVVPRAAQGWFRRLAASRILLFPCGQGPVLGENRAAPDARAKYVRCLSCGSSAILWASIMGAIPARPS